MLTCPRLITARCQSRGQSHDLWTSEPAVPSSPCPWPPWRLVCLQSQPASPASTCLLASQGLPSVTFVGLQTPTSVAQLSSLRGVPGRLHPASLEVSGRGKAGSWSRTQASEVPTVAGVGCSWTQRVQIRERFGAQRRKEGWGLSRAMGLGWGLLPGGASSPPAWLVPPRGTRGCGKSLASGKFGFSIGFATLSPGCAVGRGEASAPCTPRVAGA